MNDYAGLSFGAFVREMRLNCEKHPSLRATAAAIGVSPQFYSEVEKGRRSAFKKERLDKLVRFLELKTEEERELYTKAANSKKTEDVVVPQDFSDYIMENEYVAKALRVAKEMDTGEEEWLKFISNIQNKEG